MIYPGFGYIASNGYVDILMEEYKKWYIKKSKCNPENIEIETKKHGLGDDYHEITLKHMGLTVATFVRAYGFRYVKKIVQELKAHIRVR